MRPQVGIHENIILDKASLDDKGRLVLNLRLKDEQKQQEAPMSAFARMNAAEVIEEESDAGLILWTFKLPDDKDKTGNVRTVEQKGELVSNDISRLKNQLQQILEQYMSKDKITWSIFDGCAIAEETYYQDLNSQPNLDMIYKNIVEQFIAHIQPFLGKDEYPVRWKLARQSKDKHYARIPDRYIKDNPFIETMEVPAKDSRVKWTPYEIKEGLNDGTPVTREAADTTEPTPEAKNVFGQR
jgi:hypothetical protein